MMEIMATCCCSLEECRINGCVNQRNLDGCKTTYQYLEQARINAISENGRLQNMADKIDRIERLVISLAAKLAVPKPQ
jgi:hypothetical protein